MGGSDRIRSTNHADGTVCRATNNGVGLIEDGTDRICSTNYADGTVIRAAMIGDGTDIIRETKFGKGLLMYRRIE